jgi:hypothetical protein
VFKNYLTVALRTLRRSKGYAAINAETVMWPWR